MFFTRTRRFYSSLRKEDFINQLMGNHVTIHDMDFEVTAKDHFLRIIPHAEQIRSITTLPITHIDIKEAGNKTNVVVTSKMRKLDAGGPMLIVLFCTFMFLASMVLLFLGGEPSITYTLLSISLLLFTIFWVRMELGYFDYVRKISAHIKSRLEHSSL